MWFAQCSYIYQYPDVILQWFCFCLASHDRRVALFHVGFLGKCSCSTGDYHSPGVSARQTPGDSWSFIFLPAISFKVAFVAKVAIIPC